MKYVADGDEQVQAFVKKLAEGDRKHGIQRDFGQFATVMRDARIGNCDVNVVFEGHYVPQVHGAKLAL